MLIGAMLILLNTKKKRIIQELHTKNSSHPKNAHLFWSMLLISEKFCKDCSHYKKSLGVPHCLLREEELMKMRLNPYHCYFINPNFQIPNECPYSLEYTLEK